MNEPSDRPDNQSTSGEPRVDTSEKVSVEEFKVSGESLVTKVRELIHQGNVRRILIKTQGGRTLLEIPLTAGILGGAAGVILFPLITAIAAIAALAARFTLVVERRID